LTALVMWNAGEKTKVQPFIWKPEDLLSEHSDPISDPRLVLPVDGFIAAAVDFVDGPRGYLGRVLIDQTWDCYTDGFPCASYEYGRRAQPLACIEAPLPPLKSSISTPTEASKRSTRRAIGKTSLASLAGLYLTG